MTVRSDEVLVSAVEMTDATTVPSNPVMLKWRLDGETLTFSPQTEDDVELLSNGRFMRAPEVTGLTVQGDLQFKLRNFPALRGAMEGVCAADWGINPATGAAGFGIDTANRLTVGNTIKYFLIEKRLPNPNYSAGAMDIAVAADAAPGASLDLTYTNGPAVGTGVATANIAVDSGTVRHFHATIDAADAIGDVATALAAVIDAEEDLSASATLGVITITTTGTAITTLTAATGADRFVYQRFIGASYSNLQFSVSPNASITGSVSIVGGEPYLDELPITGVTYQDPGTSPTFKAPRVLAMTVGNKNITTACWTNVNVTLDSQNRATACIGRAGETISLGTATMSLDGEAYFEGDQEVLEYMRDSRVIGDCVLSMSNEDGEIFRFDLYNVQATSAQLTASASGQDLSIPGSFAPGPHIVGYDSTTGETWESGVVISMLNTAPTKLPTQSQVTASASAIISDESTITLAGGAANRAQSMVLNYEVDSEGSPGTDCTVSILQGDTLAEILTKLEAAVLADAGGEIATSTKTATTLLIVLGSGSTLDECSITIT